VLFFQGGTQSFKISGRLLERGGHEFDKVLFHGGVEADVKGSCGLAYHLFAGPCGFGNKNEQVSLYRGDTPHAISLFFFFG